MTLSEELVWRGFVNQSTFKDIKSLDGKKWTFYHGYDASADSQAVGNLAAMMADKVFMRHGCTAIILAGGATSLIGDPGGKDSERILQSEATIANNVSKAELQFRIVFSDQKFEIVNNLSWTKNLKVLDFLRDVGKHFSMTPLVQRDYIAKRLGEGGSGISYTEFSYTILQGMDYLHLYDKYKCNLQLGGSDQWGNCLSGVDLVRKARGAEVQALTLPLVIDKSTGKKFGKSEAGAIWLDANKTSVYQFYQFWLNTTDESVEDYLKVFTELDRPVIEKLMKEFNADKASRSAQKTLAYETTKIVHGKERADSVMRITESLFGAGRFSDLNAKDIDLLKAELVSVDVKPDEQLAKVLVRAQLASSNSEALRFIASNAVTVNDEKVDASNEYPFHKGSNLLKRGKNQFAIVDI